MTSEPHSDALVFFGATGDLAFKKVFPSLLAMVKRDHLSVPVIGVAKAGWGLEQFKARARASLEHQGPVDEPAFARLCARLGYVDGDYFYEQVGTVRDVIQNHLFQILSNLAMEPPIRTDSESIRDEKAKVLKAIPTLTAADLIRGQFNGYRQEPGVAPDSRVETFAALRLYVDSWRWQGVPFYIRAGKSLPVTCTEVLARLRRPPNLFPTCNAPPNHLRFRIGPDHAMALGVTVMDPAETQVGQIAELIAHRHAHASEMDAYERVLGDAMAGDASLFARVDYVEEAWRIVDPMLKADTPVHTYEPGTWGPAALAPELTPPGGWQNPEVSG